MNTSAIASMANVNASDVSNYKAGRWGHVSNKKLKRIMEVANYSQTDVVLWHLESGRTLTQLYATDHYRILRLSQRVIELNERFERKGEKKHIKNLNEGDRGIGVYAIYQLQNEEAK